MALDWEADDLTAIVTAINGGTYTAGGATFLGMYTRAPIDVPEPAIPPWVWCMWQMEPQQDFDTFGNVRPVTEWALAFEIHRQARSGIGYVYTLVDEIRTALQATTANIQFLWKRGKPVPIGTIGGAEVVNYTVPTFGGVA